MRPSLAEQLQARERAGPGLHNNVPPCNALGHSCSQRLGTRFLGSPSLGKESACIRQSGGILKLGPSKNPVSKSVAMPQKRGFNPSDIDNVGAYSDYHWAVGGSDASVMSSRILPIASVKPTNIDSPTKKWPMFSSAI